MVSVEEPSRSRSDEYFSKGAFKPPANARSLSTAVHMSSQYCGTPPTHLASVLLLQLLSHLLIAPKKKGYEHFPPLNKSVATHLCPPIAIRWKVRASYTAQVVLERHLWLTITEMKEVDLVPFLEAPVLSGSLLDQLWRALLNASRRLRSRLKRCDTSSLNAPALLLLPDTPKLCQLSRQPNQRQPPRSPDLLRGGDIEGAHAR